MYWSTEDHHRHHQPNYYNNYQVAQHQNGVQQATAAVPPPQQHQQTHQTPPPPPQQQQQQHQHPQQLHPNQQQHLSHRTVQQQMPGHYQANQHYQQHPQHQQQQQQLHHHQQQWVPRPSSILTAAPRLFQQFSATMPSSAQYCTAPPQFYHAPPRVTQPTAVAAPSQQRPSLPPYGFYPIQQQAAVAAAAALRQNVISQAPTNIMTPPTTTSAQSMQLQYFPNSAYCQPPAFGPVVPSAIPETPPVGKHRKHAIPIIDPDTKENVLEREFRRSESASPADVRSIGAPSSSTSADLKGMDKEPRYIPQTDDIELADQHKREEIEETIDQVEDITDSSAQLPPAVVDHVESIEAKQDLKEEEDEDVVETTRQLINNDDDDSVEVQRINATPTNENEVESKCIDNNDDDKETQSTVEENLPPTMEPTECPTTALKIDKQQQTPTQQQEQLPSPSPPPPIEIEEKTIQSPKTAPKVAASKQPQTPKPQPAQPAAVKKLPPPKKGKKNKRLKDSQRKQKAELLNTESNNNNTTKITNQNQKPIAPDPCNPTKTNIQTESATAVDSADDAGKSCAAALLDDHEKSDESSEKIDDITENSNTIDDNDQSSQIYDSPKLTKSEQIASEILGIESTDDNSVLFLNSSVSGFEDDLCPSPLDDTLENDKARDIRFGDFPEENLTQDKQQDVAEDKKYTYTLETLKSLKGEPASQIAPSLKHDHCGKIGKYSGSGPSVASYQQNHMYQQMSYKDSLNCLNRRRVKRNDTPSHQQQFQQQYDYQQQQLQQQQQQQRKPEIIRINLSLNEEIQLAKSENAWMPTGPQISAPKSESDEDEQILKKVRGILNKLTPENFEKLLQSASSFPINGPERMKKVMLLIFEKTISEPNFAPTYACFCKFLFNAKNQNHEAFNKILIKRINDEFESNVNNAKAKNAKLRPITDRLAAATEPKEVAEIKAELDDQEYKFRRRAWGTVRFIGEMFKLGFISTEKVCACVEELFDPKCEEKLEYMCKLLTTVGAQLEPVNKHLTSADKNINNRLSELFTKIRQVVERKKLSGIKISSRVRFMLQDVCDLRRRSWDQKISSTPSAAMRSRESSPAITKVTHQSQQRDRGPPPRTANNYIQSGGAYDKRRQQTAGDEQKKSAQNKIDINKLMPMFINVDTTRPLGNSSLPKWHQRGQPSVIMQQNSRTPLSNSECKRLLNDLVELVIDDEPKTNWFAEWKQIPSDQHPTLIYYLFAEYLLSAKLQRVEINACSRLFISLIREKLLTHAAFSEGYHKFSDDSYDILLDVPKGWQYIFNFLGPLLHLELIPFSMIWCPKWFDSPDGEKFLHSMIRHFTFEFGANYMRYFWQAFLQWETFMTEDRAHSFIASNSFEFIENEKCTPPKLGQRTVDEQVQRIKELLSESGQNVVDLVIDFLSTNVHIDCSFIRKLTSFICDHIVIYNNTPNSTSLSSNSNKKSKLSNSGKHAAATLRKGELKTMCIPIFRRCIDSKDEHELSCLDAIVKRCKDLYGSSADNLICEILTEMDGVVISKESFEKWYQRHLSHDDNILTNDLNEFFQSRHDCD